MVLKTIKGVDMHAWSRCMTQDAGRLAGWLAGPEGADTRAH